MSYEVNNAQELQDVEKIKQVYRISHHYCFDSCIIKTAK